LAAGVIEHAVQSLRGVLRQPSARILAYLGPAIGPCHFEVGPEVKAVMMQRWPQADVAFTPGLGDRSYADLYALARLSLASVGVEAVYGGTDCTHCRPERYFSYRRDGVTGRMASLIWRS
jgi:copper oxidase (laccase) domain-containing protein